MKTITLFLYILSWISFGYFLLGWVVVAWANLREKTPVYSVKTWAVIAGMIALSYLIAYHLSA